MPKWLLQWFFTSGFRFIIVSKRLLKRSGKTGKLREFHFTKFVSTLSWCLVWNSCDKWINFKIIKVSIALHGILSQSCRVSLAICNHLVLRATQCKWYWIQEYIFLWCFIYTRLTQGYWKMVVKMVCVCCVVYTHVMLHVKCNTMQYLSCMLHNSEFLFDLWELLELYYFATYTSLIHIF